MKILFTSLITSLLVISCSEPKNKGVELDLMSYGLPISVQAPEGATVKVDDMGVWIDASIRSEDDYFVQVLSSEATTLNTDKILEEKKSEIKNHPYFSKMVEEKDNGFIYEKKIDEQTLDYDFIVVRIQGDREYIYSTGLIGNFNEEQVRNMYDSVL